MTQYNYNKSLENRIMRRVQVIWFMKNTLIWMVGEAILFSLFLYFLFSQTSLNSVLNNILQHSGSKPLSFPIFAYNAFMYTDMIVKMAVIGMAVMLAIIVKQCAFGFKNYLSERKLFQ